MSSLATNGDLPVSLIDGEPRVFDLDFGRYLEFASPIDIRKIIRRHEAALSELGVLAAVAITPGAAGGRPGTANYLNRRQALFVTAKSETSKAIAKTIELVERFDEYERGASRALSPAEAHLQQAMLMVEFERRQNAIIAKQEEQDRRIGANEQATRQIQTAVDWFTVIAYAKCAKNTSLDTRRASKLGKAATRIAKGLGVPPADVPDGRYGRVHQYPKAVLDAAWVEVFGEAH